MSRENREPTEDTPQKEQDHHPELSVEEMRMPELVEAIELVLEGLSHDQGEIAAQANQVFRDVRTRDFHGKDDQVQRIVDRTLQSLEIDRVAYLNAVALSLIPITQLPQAEWAVQSQALNRIVVPVDQAITSQLATLSNKNHYTDRWRSLIYDIAELEVASRDGKEMALDSLTGIIRDQSYLKQLYDIEIKYLEVLPDMHGMLVVRIDVDNFKAINHAFGHDAADKILQQFANGLSSAFRGRLDAAGRVNTINVVPGRPGGDEFAVILNDVDFGYNYDTPDVAEVPSPQQLHPTIQAVLSRIQSVATAIDLPDGDGHLTISIGAARLHAEDAKGKSVLPTFEEMMKRADEASIWAKRHDDGMAAEWVPQLPEVPMTVDRAMRGLKKDFARRHPEQDLTDLPGVMEKMQALARSLVEAYKRTDPID